MLLVIGQQLVWSNTAAHAHGAAATSRARTLLAGTSTRQQQQQQEQQQQAAQRQQWGRRRGAVVAEIGDTSLPIYRRPQAPTLNQQLPMVEICANGQVIRYQSTLTSIRSMYGQSKLTSRDVRLLRSSAPFLAPRQGYMLFDLGELRGILQHDRLILIGADLPAVGALGAEIQRRLEQDQLAQRTLAEEAPFEVRALECMLEQVYSVFDETLQTLSVLVSNTLRDLTNPVSGRGVSSEGRREAALSRLLPLRISLSALQARSRRISVLLDEILDSEDDVKDMCLTFLHDIETRAAERRSRRRSSDAAAASAFGASPDGASVDNVPTAVDAAMRRR